MMRSSRGLRLPGTVLHEKDLDYLSSRYNHESGTKVAISKSLS